MSAPEETHPRGRTERQPNWPRKMPRPEKPATNKRLASKKKPGRPNTIGKVFRGAIFEARMGRPPTGMPHSFSDCELSIGYSSRWQSCS